MKIFDIFKKKEKINILEIIEKKGLIKRYFLLVLGILLSAISFNMFFYPLKIVVGGISGVSIIINKLFNFNPTIFIYIVNGILIVFSYFLLGKEKTLKSLVGSLLFPLFVEITSFTTTILNISNDTILLYIIFGSVLSGISSGIIFKTGFSGGGTDILTQIFSKYSKISIGKAMLIINTIIIGTSGIVFSINSIMYALISLYIISIITDKVLLGISEDKVFFIVTDKEDEIKDYIVDNLKHTVTVLKGMGGFSNKKNNLLMTVVPTKEYFILKELIQYIDNDAFFVVSDSYQVIGGE